ncbi:GNAT family N-acetyltransferase [Spongiactinospora sp. TRM90649]|uniref:GNAT family N-acetyltransferase n=1 Tax=Spongiactinospora sp. TRM90649 TaxID=3031114 RepID=UPI0023F99345|nr:GNAT family N-acetyltransferase [Spongiactinospora sp. TRM90649]MDF5758281.1 GNAT family N-acetyltransferase [Spongiactinospora sp. TRM90649]
MTPAVRGAAETEAGHVADLIATAFAPLAATAFLVPPPTARHDVMTANFRIFVDHALHHGEIDVIRDGPGIAATAVWFPHTVPLPEPPDYDRRLVAACGEWTERFRVLDTLFEKHHPAEPYHHLAFLAVHPSWQNRGLGSTLLRHHHARLDPRVPAYLEASGLRSRSLYCRHGYLPRAPFHLPDGTPFWPMWRPAGSPP